MSPLSLSEKPDKCVIPDTFQPSGQDAARAHIAVVRDQRERMARALAKVPGVREVLPSQANFLAVRFEDASSVYRRLLGAGIVVRDIQRYPQLGDALRITVGLPEENDRVLDVLQNRLQDDRMLAGRAPAGQRP